MKQRSQYTGMIFSKLSSALSHLFYFIGFFNDADCAQGHRHPRCAGVKVINFAECMQRS
jgi:hypothetical protein